MANWLNLCQCLTFKLLISCNHFNSFWIVCFARRLRKLKIIAAERSYVDVILAKMASQIDIITFYAVGCRKPTKIQNETFVFRHLLHLFV